LQKNKQYLSPVITLSFGGAETKEMANSSLLYVDDADWYLSENESRS
jgi:hypothetical protein